MDGDLLVRHRVVVADPPWRYRQGLWQRSASKAATHYPTLSLEDVCAMPVEDHVAEDAYLFLWITNRKLVEGWGQAVAEAWGFRALTFAVWIKPWMGLGMYWRNCHENIVLGVRGSPGPFRRRDWRSWFRTERRLSHSEKPEEFLGAVEAHAEGPYLELFARKTRPGWTTWGHAVGDPLGIGFDPEAWRKAGEDA